jgi:hypothetical protein
MECDNEQRKFGGERQVDGADRLGGAHTSGVSGIRSRSGVRAIGLRKRGPRQSRG